MTVRAQMVVLGLLFSVVVLLSQGTCVETSCDDNSDVYYVVPHEYRKQDCPSSSDHCYTLEQYATNVSLSCSETQSKISLVFLNGVHKLHHSLEIIPSLEGSLSCEFLCMCRAHSSVSEVQGTVTIQLFDKAKIVLSAVNVTVKQLTFVSNGLLGLDIRTQNEVDGQFLVSGATFLCSSLSVFGDGLFRSVLIENSTFIEDSEPCFSTPPMEIIFFKQVSIVSVIIIDLNVNHSFASKQIVPDMVVYLPYPDSSADITIMQSTFNRSSSTGILVRSQFGGHSNPSTAHLTVVNIMDTIVFGHWNGAIVFDMMFELPAFVNLYVTLANMRVVGNSFSMCSDYVYNHGAGLTIYSIFDPEFSFNRSVINIVGSEFSYNTNLCSNGVIINTNRLVDNITLNNCHFQGNTGSSILVSNANLIFGGNITFFDNSAYRGAALYLSSCTACIYFVGCVTIVFKNNSAIDVGGAIYINEGEIEFGNRLSSRKCFYQIPPKSNPCVNVTFSHNKANQGGEHIYGALMESNCIVFAPYGTPNSNGKNYVIRGYEAHSSMLHYSPYLENSVSPISSVPLRVCLCDRSKNGNVSIDVRCRQIGDIFISKTVHPGELFDISVSLVGTDFGTTTGSVYAQLLPLQSTHIKPLLGLNYQYSQPVMNYSSCSSLTYSVNSSNEKEMLILTATNMKVSMYGDKNAVKSDDQDTDSFKLLHTTPIYINISLLSCPLGFFLSNKSQSCECDVVLLENDISCAIRNGSGCVYRHRTFWINATMTDENKTDIIVHKHCPYNYCSVEKLAIDLKYPDTQCAFHHVGVLCGGCEQNYSLALGSDKCLKCADQSHLSLLIFFVFSGVLLVFFIQIFDLTVKQGTINGLIFYANIVWAYRSIFVSDPSNVTGIYAFLLTFVAWLNLDFGIETCFFNGLNAYWKSWLQFTYPLYVWIIAGFVIKSSNSFKNIANLFGKNSVHVLATLLLLSYNKLLRTIITIMDFTYLISSATNSKLAVWSFDANLKYCEYPHVILFVAAVVALVFFWLPYTLVLVLVQWLRNERISRLWIMHWIDSIKLKPFFDAYLDPFKDRHRYWVGVLLIVRGVLMVTFALTSANTPSANLLAIGLFTALVLLHQGYNGRLYKRKTLSFLENSFFCNLLLLSLVALYLNNTSRFILCISTGVAFFQFICIVLFHAWMKIAPYCHRIRHREYDNIDDNLDNIVFDRDNDTHDK